MGYEYKAIPDDVEDYRRRRQALLLQIESLPTFAGRGGPEQAGLDDAPHLQRNVRWGDPVQLWFEPDRVHVLCAGALSEALRRDLRELLRMIGGRYVDDDGEPAAF